MKTNKAKIIVPTLALAMAAALVGSISGTVAWYQYSTRATAAFVGVTAGTTRNLEAKVGGSTSWKTDWKVADTSASGVLSNSSVSPVTTGEKAKDAALGTLKSHPIYQHFTTSSWGNAAVTDYIQFTVNFQVKDNGTVVSADKPVGLTNVTIRDADEGGQTGLYKAIRVHLAAGTGEGAKYALVNSDGANTNVYGNLDLNGDLSADGSDNYEWDDHTGVAYGDDGKVQAAYSMADTAGAGHLYVDDSTSSTLTGGFQFTTADTLTVTIFIEGWHKLGETPSATWDRATWAGKNFNVGLAFTTISE